jgi:hypothetical protein
MTAGQTSGVCRPPSGRGRAEDGGETLGGDGGRRRPVNTRGRTAGRKAHGAWHRIAVGVAGLTLYGLAAASWVSGQTILDRPARLEVEGVPLVDALRLLQERAPVPLVYSPELVPERQVSCDCGTRTVRQALEVLPR